MTVPRAASKTGARHSTRYLANLSQESVLTLPPRWFTSQVLVELMTALYVGYLSVYSPRQRVPSMALIEWHERGLWPTLDRIKALRLITRGGELSEVTSEVKTDSDAVDVLAGPGDKTEEAEVRGSSASSYGEMVST
jgi:hypothetical protein